LQQKRKFKKSEVIIVSNSMQLLLLFKKSLRSSDSKPRKVEAEKDVVTG